MSREPQATKDYGRDWFIMLVCTTSTISDCLAKGLKVINYWLLVMTQKQVTYP